MRHTVSAHYTHCVSLFHTDSRWQSIEEVLLQSSPFNSMLYIGGLPQEISGHLHFPSLPSPSVSSLFHPSPSLPFLLPPSVFSASYLSFLLLSCLPPSLCLLSPTSSSLFPTCPSLSPTSSLTLSPLPPHSPPPPTSLFPTSHSLSPTFPLTLLSPSLSPTSPSLSLLSQWLSTFIFLPPPHTHTHTQLL